MSNYKIERIGNYKIERLGNDACVIKEKGKTVAQMIGELAVIKTKSIRKEFIDELSCLLIKGKPKSLKQDKRKIKELERLLWQ